MEAEADDDLVRFPIRCVGIRRAADFAVRFVGSGLFRDVYLGDSVAVLAAVRHEAV
ncbi:hypothetical protein D3C76_1462460 [compost metagenome]